MRLGGAGKTRNGHSYIIRDRNNVRFPFPSPGDLRIDPSTNQPTGEAFTLSPKRTYAGRLVSKFCTRNRATHEENNCESYSRDGRTRVIARNARECRLINYHKSLSILFHTSTCRFEQNINPCHSCIVISRSYIFAFAVIKLIEFLMMLFLLVQLSGTYVRFRKQSGRRR